jgi:nitroreductase
MDFFELIQARRSVRVFTPKPVEASHLKAILEAAQSAPSAGNLQAYEIYLVQEEKQRQALVKAASGQEFISQAPVVLGFCANPGRAAVRYGKRGEQLYAVQDATIACTYAMLAATALGLASVWVGAFNVQAVRRALQAREEYLPVALLPVGYAGEQPPPRGRRSLENLVHKLE